MLQQREEPLSLKISTGSVTLQQGFSKPKTPLSIQQWTDAFLIYMAIYIDKYLEQAPHHLKYCFFIREMHKMLGNKSWRAYDENFRMLRESSDLQWQKPVEELRVQFSIPAALSNSVMPSMVNLVHTTPALTATSVSYVQCHMQESTEECEDKNKVQSIQPNPHKTPTICQYHP